MVSPTHDVLNLCNMFINMLYVVLIFKVFGSCNYIQYFRMLYQISYGDHREGEYIPPLLQASTLVSHLFLCQNAEYNFQSSLWLSSLLISSGIFLLHVL